MFLTAPVFLEGGCWDRYRQHPDSSVHVAERDGAYHPTRHHPARRLYLDWLEGYMREKGCTDAELWKAFGTARSRDLHPKRYALPDAVRYLLWRVKLLVRAVLPERTYRWLAGR